MSDDLPWELRGTYMESCNCEAICPCRSIGGRKGGRSTHGICMGALSWAIQGGRAADIDLSGLNVVLALRTATMSPALRGPSGSTSTSAATSASARRSPTSSVAVAGERR